MPTDPSLTPSLLREHLDTVVSYAMRGITADACLVRAHTEDERGRPGNDWSLFVAAGPEIRPKAPGLPFFLAAELCEEFVEPHDYLDDRDEIESVTRARLQLTGDLPDLIAQLATWLLANGWRGNRGGLVRQAPAHAELLVADGRVYALRRTDSSYDAEPIES